MLEKNTPFKIKIFVILPEHLHMIWELPVGDSNYSLRWSKIKGQFSVHQSGILLTKTKHNEYRLWQRRFWEHTIKDQTDFENHVHYIHYNPIKHGLVENLHHWLHSSFHYCVQNGRIAGNWGEVKMDGLDKNCFGK